MQKNDGRVWFECDVSELHRIDADEGEAEPSRALEDYVVGKQLAAWGRSAPNEIEGWRG